MIRKTIIGKSPNDKDFRRVVNEAISSAQREIDVIAGELGSYLFPELKDAAIKAIRRGVHVRIYATYAVPPEIYDEIRDAGGEIYLGQKQVKDHFLRIDERTCIISKKEQLGEPTKIGEREAIVCENDPSDARRIKRLTSELVFLSFMEKDKEQSILSKVANTIFQLFIPGYGEISVEGLANE